MLEVLSVTSEWSPLLALSTVKVLKVRGGESFCTIKLYCNEVPDGKI